MIRIVRGFSILPRKHMSTATSIEIRVASIEKNVAKLNDQVETATNMWVQKENEKNAEIQKNNELEAKYGKACFAICVGLFTLAVVHV